MLSDASRTSLAEYENGSLSEPEVKTWNGTSVKSKTQNGKSLIVISVEIAYWHSLMLKIIRLTEEVRQKWKGKLVSKSVQLQVYKTTVELEVLQHNMIIHEKSFNLKASQSVSVMV